ncbi:hypothetical protein L0657_04845 [Dyadobacter sp. CY345]|uniref:GREB1-related protein n=1 Tax=Dyadobacter sp. CY345 TaxID=2909335 RepID=UPI001F20D1E3|nr:hypothetical protein [Dyadobacter sp. CY345]MCF2443275.1 hypothetical protein [Dyadobacter sp. CY345]
MEESQEDLYWICNSGIEIITHPDSIIGLARKRDWIIKNVGRCFMLDADIDHLTRIYSERGEETHVNP